MNQVSRTRKVIAISAAPDSILAENLGSGPSCLNTLFPYLVLHVSFKLGMTRLHRFSITHLCCQDIRRQLTWERRRLFLRVLREISPEHLIDRYLYRLLS